MPAHSPTLPLAPLFGQHTRYKGTANAANRKVGRNKKNIPKVLLN